MSVPELVGDKTVSRIRLFQLLINIFRPFFLIPNSREDLRPTHNGRAVWDGLQNLSCINEPTRAYGLGFPSTAEDGPKLRKESPLER